MSEIWSRDGEKRGRVAGTSTALAGHQILSLCPTRDVADRLRAVT
jgi:hypothetical protein